MSPSRQVYLLNPQELSPETIAVTFAKTSRAPESFREIAAELTEERSAEFHEKWVVGYGHASVAEHAVLHIAIENVSRLAVEAIESNRLASYTEKSTRYQKWNPDAYSIPTELSDPQFRQEYIGVCHDLFAAYQKSLPLVQAAVEKEMPREVGESDGAWGRRLRSKYIDACRFLLPAAAMANVGMTANARVLEHAIQKLLSDPLDEVRSIGNEICQVAQAEIPTLLKYADRSEYLVETAAAFEAAGKTTLTPRKAKDWCQLVAFDPQGEEKVLAAALYRFGGMDYASALETICNASPAERRRLAEMLLSRLGKFDIPLRELEHTSFTFDLVVDQGCYFEIKRHRMMTQTPQMLHAGLGYAVPRRIEAAGFSEDYCQAMDAAGQVYERLAEQDPHIAAYVVPNGYNRRLLLTFNLRSAFHFCKLRSAANAHFSVRRVAQRVAEEIRQVAPGLAAFMGVNPGETWQSLEQRYFVQV